MAQKSCQIVLEPKHFFTDYQRTLNFQIRNVFIEFL